MARNWIQDFRDDEDGSMAVELLLVTPIIVWALLSTLVYFDLFRVESNSNRAALTIADMFSRESTVDDDFVDGARDVLRALTYEEANPDLRVTSYSYDETRDRYARVWTEQRGFGRGIRNSDLASLKSAGRLPVMANGDRAILVETRTQYDAPFSIGLGPFTGTNLDDVTFTTFVVIRARPGRLCFDNTPGNPDDAEIC